MPTTNPRVATVTIDRPPLNILDIATIGSLTEAIREAAAKPTTDVLVIAAAGSRVFSAGVEIHDHTPDKVPAMLESFHGLIRLLLQVEPVTVCQVQAPALGGGAEIPLVCDLVVAARESRLAFPEIDLACFPPVALAALPFRIGPQRAADLVLTGAAISAEEALGLGLVSRVAPKEELADATARLLEELTGKSSEVLKLTARVFRQAYRPRLLEELKRVEEAYLSDLCATDDMKEGIASFIEKRKPVWKRPG